MRKQLRRLDFLHLAFVLGLLLNFSFNPTCCWVGATLHCPGLGALGFPVQTTLPLLLGTGVRALPISLWNMQGPLWSECWPVVLQGRGPAPWCPVAKAMGSGTRLLRLKAGFHHVLLVPLLSRAVSSQSFKYAVFLYLHLCEGIFICSGKDCPSPRMSESHSYVMKKRCNYKLRVNLNTRWPCVSC